MTAEQLEELLDAYQNGGMCEILLLRDLAPSLARRVIAAEKLVEVLVGYVSGGERLEPDDLGHYLTAYREASK